ncbi:MAG: UDP-N-acetylglucosamine 1-carboxyvinyltransferase [bacterium]
MEKISIFGGRKLSGDVVISGAKNAALPILVATLLTDDQCSLYNIPDLRDINTIMEVLGSLGKKIYREGDCYIASAPDELLPEAPYELVRTMRASVLVLGPLLARRSEAKVALPGGCAIGLRPINLHLKGFEKLGAEVSIKEGYVLVSASKLKGANIYLDLPSVGATENIMMAAVLAEGKTIIENAACEPEIVDLANFLNKMGANIQGMGTSVIKIDGVKRLKGVQYTIIPDRIEAGTFMVAGAVTRGDIRLKNIMPAHLHSVTEKLREAGVEVEVEKGDNTLVVKANGELKPIGIKTMPFPGFPTDMQAQFMALMCVTKGTSVITETVFENRFMHVAELCRMGAKVTIKGNSAIVKGVSKLSGAPVMATDLRASAALVIAGLVAEGKTVVSRVYHIDRGYDKIEDKLSKLGAKIRRTKG